MSVINRLFFTEPIYQSEWNGISLTDIANTLGIPKHQLSKDDVYALFYKRLKQNNFITTDTWAEKKKRLGQTWGRLLKKHHVSKEAPILSVGAGLGIIEAPFIREGYNITLQECQESSFEYLKKQGLTFKEIISSQLLEIPTNSYDMVTIFYVAYALPSSEYKTLLKDCYRILKPGGTLILFDGMCTLKRITPISWVKKALKKRLQRHSNAIFWGWARHPRVHHNLLKQAKFNNIRNFVTDDEGKITSMPRLGFKWSDPSHALQWFIAQK